MPSPNDRRRHGPETVALIITVLVQIIALTWGAANVAKTVQTLVEAGLELRQTLQQVQGAMHNLDARVRVLEDRGNRHQSGQGF